MLAEQIMNGGKRAKLILKILQREFSLPSCTNTIKKPFSTLIKTILSQATNDKNSNKAFRNLGKKFEITPQTLAIARAEEIEEAIRIGGLYRNKSRVIKELSSIILKRFEGKLDFIYSMPVDKARKRLIALPGVGPKTADVTLLFAAGKPVLPVDTHVYRVSKRLGMVAMNLDYEGTRLALELLYSPKDYLAVHLLLIMLGRKYCKAKNPFHESCPLNMLCPSSRLER